MNSVITSNHYLSITSLRSLIILIPAFCISCNSPKANHPEEVKSKEKIPAVKINLPQKGEKQLNASEFADTVLYVPLETNSKSLLGGIHRIQILAESILVAGNDRLHLFSKEGKFIRQIGKNGNGPGEYTFITDFVAVKDTVYISPTNKNVLFKYLLNGNFIKEYKLPDNFKMSWFDITPDKKYISYQLLNRGKLCILDKDLTKVDTFVINHNAPDNTPRTIFRERFDYCLENGSGRRFLFTDYMNDTIWDLSNGKKEIGYILNMGNNLLPEKYRFERFGYDHERWMKAAAPYQKIKLIETPSFLFLFQKKWIEEDKLNVIYIYDRIQNSIKRYNTTYVFDDLVGKQNLIPLYSSKDCFMAVIRPYELNETLKKNTGNDRPLPLWVQQMASVEENDNAILVIMPVRK